MLYIIAGFVFGFLIPYLARRLGKLMPATTGYVLLKIFVPCHYMPWNKLKNNPQYMSLFKSYIMRSVGWAIFAAAVTAMFVFNFDPYFTGYYVAFLWIMLLLVEIDKRFMLLPDIFTLPLLILGFLYASREGVWLDTEVISNSLNSALGSIVGYVMPVIASLFLVLKYPDAFGGGDIKLLAAIGAWVGIEIIPFILLSSCAIFAITCLVFRQRAGAFGPAIVYSTIIVALLLF